MTVNTSSTLEEATSSIRSDTSTPLATTKHTIFCIRHGEAVHNVMMERLGRPAIWQVVTGRLPWQIDTDLTDAGHAQSTALSNEFPEKKNLKLVFVSPLSRTLQTMSNIFRSEIESTGRFRVETAWMWKYTKQQLETMDVTGYDQSVRERELMNSDCVCGLEGLLSPASFSEEQTAQEQYRSELPIRFVATEHAREYAMGMSINVRKSRSYLQKTYPWVDFSLLDTEDDEASWAHLKNPEENFHNRVHEGLRVESIACFERRVAEFKHFLKEQLRSETVCPAGALWEDEDQEDGDGEKKIRVAVVGHGTSLGMLMNGVMGDEKTALKHSFPYRLEL